MNECTGLKNLYIQAKGLRDLDVSGNKSLGENTLWVNDWGYSKGAWNSPFEWQNKAVQNSFKARNCDFCYWTTRTGARNKKGELLNTEIQFGSYIEDSDTIISYEFYGHHSALGYTRYSCGLEVGTTHFDQVEALEVWHWNSETRKDTLTKGSVGYTRWGTVLNKINIKAYSYVFTPFSGCGTAESQLWLYPFGK